MSAKRLKNRELARLADSMTEQQFLETLTKIVDAIVDNDEDLAMLIALSAIAEVLQAKL
jgi:hypothetical protein